MILKSLLQRAFSSDAHIENVEERQLKELRDNAESGIAASGENENAVVTTSAYSSDLEALTARYGELKPGMSIEMTLHEALTLMPRTRHKADAYKGVKSQLNRMGVTFSIVNPSKK